MNEIKQLLEEQFLRFNTPAFIEGDPVQVPHRFSQPENIEIAGFLAATLAWGQREVITRNSFDLICRMDNDPFDFLLHMEETDLKVFRGFRHRTFKEEDAVFLARGLQQIWREDGGLANVFRKGFEATGDAGGAIDYFRSRMLEIPHEPRSRKHIASPAAGSSAKRLNMFLRWMVRKDAAGVDFGLWDFMSASDLYLPLDLHTGRIARHMGLLKRKQDDWKAVSEITSVLRTFDPQDPVKYDYALFGMGFYDGFPNGQ